MRTEILQDAGLKPQKPQASESPSSRQAILLAATRLATLKGLDGLSIGDLAAEVGMSKSGLYAHFKSKEELELATIETAMEIFTREVRAPAMVAPEGVARLKALVNAFLDHLERQVFPGGCFFAAVATELDTRPGPARDRVFAVQKKWLGLLEDCLHAARKNGEMDFGGEVTQAVFEVNAMLLAANFQFVMSQDREPLMQARKGVQHVLERGGLNAKAKKKH